MDAIHSGEREALRRLYDRYSNFAMAIGARYLPDSDEVRDVLQDCFVKILTSIGQFNYHGEGSLKAWVGRIVCNRSVDYLREHQRFVVVSDIPDELDEVEEPDLEGVPPDELTAMIGRLPANYRTVLNLFAVEQRSHKEIAQLLGIKASTSSSLLFRARRMLGKMIKDNLNRERT